MKNRRKFMLSIASSIPIALAGCLESEENNPEETTENQTTDNPETHAESSRDKPEFENNTNFDIELTNITISEPNCFTGLEEEQSNLSAVETSDGYEINFRGRKFVSDKCHTIRVDTSVIDNGNTVEFRISERKNKEECEKCVSYVSYTGIATVKDTSIDNFEIKN